MKNDLLNLPHRRLNPLIREWVLVSPQRTARPWQGQVESVSPAAQLQYDPDCYLCPGNQRAADARNPVYPSTFVFGNDFPALLPDTPGEQVGAGLLIAQGEPGICRVVCFSPRHDLTISQMSLVELRKVVDVWTEQYQALGSLPQVNWVQIFENRGAMMGASNPHPHCQIWTNLHAPNELAKETESQHQYHRDQDHCLLCDYLESELTSGERLVCANEFFQALVPFWAVWPFEIMVLSRRHLTGLDELTEAERDALGNILKQITTRYDNLFHTPFPYSMGFHQRPTDGSLHPEWHLHVHFLPPLLRSATVRKFMVGYELLATPQRDLTPESAADMLRVAGKIPR